MTGPARLRSNTSLVQRMAPMATPIIAMRPFFLLKIFSRVSYKNLTIIAIIALLLMKPGAALPVKERSQPMNCPAVNQAGQDHYTEENSIIPKKPSPQAGLANQSICPGNAKSATAWASFPDK